MLINTGWRARDQQRCDAWVSSGWGAGRPEIGFRLGSQLPSGAHGEQTIALIMKLRAWVYWGTILWIFDGLTRIRRVSIWVLQPSHRHSLSTNQHLFMIRFGKKIILFFGSPAQPWVMTQFLVGRNKIMCTTLQDPCFQGVIRRTLLKWNMESWKILILWVMLNHQNARRMVCIFAKIQKKLEGDKTRA